MFNYEQVMDMNFPCPIEEGRWSINPYGYLRLIDTDGFPCTTPEPVNPGSAFDYRPVPTFEEVFAALPSGSCLYISRGPGPNEFIITTYKSQVVAKEESMASAICNAYLWFKHTPNREK